MFKIKIEQRLWFWEKKRFQRLHQLLENSPEQYVEHVRADVEKILEGKYHTGEGGSHIWIHRKRLFNRKNPLDRLAIITKS